MINEKIIKHLEEEPQLLEENKEIYRSVLKKNGFKENSTFVAFATTYGTEFNGSEGFMFNVVRDLMDESATGVNYNMHNVQDVPSNLISLLEDTIYAFLLYNKEDDPDFDVKQIQVIPVYDMEFSGDESPRECHQIFRKELIPPDWNRKLYKK